MSDLAQSWFTWGNFFQNILIYASFGLSWLTYGYILPCVWMYVRTGPYHHCLLGKQAQCNIELTNKYPALQNLANTDSVEVKWQNIKWALTTACKTTMERKSGKHHDWITPDRLQKVSISREIKEALNFIKTQSTKATQEYSKANIQVRNSARRDMR